MLGQSLALKYSIERHYQEEEGKRRRRKKKPSPSLKSWLSSAKRRDIVASTSNPLRELLFIPHLSQEYVSIRAVCPTDNVASKVQTQLPNEKQESWVYVRGTPEVIRSYDQNGKKDRT
jgi:hypothetical protein